MTDEHEKPKCSHPYKTGHIMVVLTPTVGAIIEVCRMCFHVDVIEVVTAKEEVKGE